MCRRLLVSCFGKGVSQGKNVSTVCDTAQCGLAAMQSDTNSRRPTNPVRPSATPCHRSGLRHKVHNLVHRLALGEFINQLVEVPNLAHQRVFDFLNPNATDNPFNERHLGVQCRRFGKEGREVILTPVLPFLSAFCT